MYIRSIRLRHDCAHGQASLESGRCSIDVRQMGTTCFACRSRLDILQIQVRYLLAVFQPVAIYQGNIAARHMFHRQHPFQSDGGNLRAVWNFQPDRVLAILPLVPTPVTNPTQSLPPPMGLASQALASSCIAGTRESRCFLTWNLLHLDGT